MYTISVITIAYNNKSGLERTIRSVVNQSFDNFEFIVIDGGSGDGSKEIIHRYSDKISYWVSEPDKGIYHAMNKGIKAAKGEYLIFINSGDELYNERSLQTASQYLGKEDIVYSDLEYVDHDKKYISKYPSELGLLHFIKNSLPHPSSFIRRSAFEQVGFYDEKLDIVSDWKWFLLAIIKYKLSYLHIPEVISSFYLDGISSQSANQEKIDKERNRTFEEIYSFSPKDTNEIIALYYQTKNLNHKIDILKKSRLLKILHQLGVFKAYKYL